MRVSRDCYNVTGFWHIKFGETQAKSKTASAKRITHIFDWRFIYIYFFLDFGSFIRIRQNIPGIYIIYIILTLDTAS